MENIIKKAGILIEAIPYIHEFRQKVFVIKYGGSILDNDAIRKVVLEDIVFLSFVGIRPVLIHGGGPHISSRIKETGLKSEFHNGIRVTDAATLTIVEEEFRKLNQKITREIKELRGDVVGLQGHEGLVRVEKKQSDRDLGFVGEALGADIEKIISILSAGKIAVISPMGCDAGGQMFNVNADETASAIAKAMKAEKLVLLTDVKGVMRNPADLNSLISSLTLKEMEELQIDQVIQGGMIPKVNACAEALAAGIHKVHIIDARIPHALLLEFFTDKGIGTQIVKE
ncbi:MAG: acetylglutamate kinase [Candidatus Omnitrophica bacterium CG12_big_fil_rev_8_21_14_0_65_50_5]|nr:MAG: acetylglutamate kinase [Candidatus Omnitrophica bacterium CG12_big_fil_rev_8_21_14_0_65_50_5]